MQSLWHKIDGMKLTIEAKYAVCILIMSLINGCFGFIAWWLLIQPASAESAVSAVCFLGYPVIFSMLAVLFYSFRHDFHGRHRRYTDEFNIPTLK